MQPDMQLALIHATACAARLGSQRQMREALAEIIEESREEHDGPITEDWLRERGLDGPPAPIEELKLRKGRVIVTFHRGWRFHVKLEHSTLLVRGGVFAKGEALLLLAALEEKEEPAPTDAELRESYPWAYGIEA